MTTIAVERAAVVAEARTWVGTPFHHGVALKGAGVDCARFLIEVYTACGVVAPFTPPTYAPDWFLHTDFDHLVAGVVERCVKADRPASGDTLLYRFGRRASHAALYLGDDMVIHAFRRRGVVVEECGPGSALAARFHSAWTPIRWSSPLNFSRAV